MDFQFPLINRITFKSKFIVLALLASVVSILVIAGLSSVLGRRSLRQATFTQLSLLRSEKAQQVQRYFQTLRSHTLTLSADQTLIAAMVEFNKEFRRLDRTFIPTEWDEPLQAYYERSYFPDLATITGTDPLFGRYRPSGQAGRYLQHHYLSETEGDFAEKNLTIAAEDESEYSRYHGEFHPLLNDIVQQFGYADLYLINHKTGDVVYSVNKAPDYGTNLETGPYRESHLADLVATVREDAARGEVVFADYQAYEPSFGKPVLFAASPIYNGPYVVGILAIALDVAPLNQMMAEPESRHDSLDSYIVGSNDGEADGYLRSETRAFEENAERYVRLLRRRGLSDEITSAITRTNSPILFQPIETLPARQALGGDRSDGMHQRDYLGTSVLTAYAPLDIEGLNWAILSQINTAEALRPMNQLEMVLLIASILLITAFTFLAMAAASITTRPIAQLNAWADRVVDGDLDAELDLEVEDEIGELVDTLQIMVASLSHQVATLDQKMEQNKVLLANLVPPAIAKRIKRGEKAIADQVKQVSILYANIVGVAELSRTLPADEVTALLTKLMQAFDEAAERHGVERQRTASTDYMALCGLTTARLDHAKRTVDFALEMLKIIALPEFGQSHSLGLRLAVHTGEVTAGVVGTKRFGYSVWGESIYLVTRLYAHAALNSVVFTQAVHERIADAYTCLFAGAIAIERLGEVDTWLLVSREKMAVRQVDLVQASFAEVKPMADQLAAQFYQRLFEVRPDTRALFQNTDMAAQKQKLMLTLAIAVQGLREPEKIIQTVQELGQRHEGYGVKAEDYEDVGASLLWALEQSLGKAFSAEVRRAWEVALQFLSNIMISAAAQTESETMRV